jgi:hypothetical protein
MTIMNNLGILLIFFITIVFTLLIILIIIEKKLHKKIIKNENSRNMFYLERIGRINKKDPDKALTSIDKIAKDFFKEAFKVKRNMGYDLLGSSFKQKNNVEVARFCSLMNDSLYSGKKKNDENIKGLILILESIVKNNLLYTKEELERKNLEKEGLINYLKNIKISCVGKKKFDNK